MIVGAVVIIVAIDASATIGVYIHRCNCYYYQYDYLNYYDYSDSCYGLLVLLLPLLIINTILSLQWLLLYYYRGQRDSGTLMAICVITRTHVVLILPVALAFALPLLCSVLV